MARSTIYNTPTHTSNDRITIIPYKGYRITLKHEHTGDGFSLTQFLAHTSITVEFGDLDVTRSQVIKKLREWEEWETKECYINPNNTIAGTGEMLALVFMALDALLGEI